MPSRAVETVAERAHDLRKPVGVDDGPPSNPALVDARRASVATAFGRSGESTACSGPVKLTGSNRNKDGGSQMRLPYVAAAPSHAFRTALRGGAFAVLFAAGVLSGGCDHAGPNAKPFRTTITKDGRTFVASVNTTESSFGEPQELRLSGACPSGKVAFRIRISPTSGSESVDSTIGNAQALVENSPSQTSVTVSCPGTTETATMTFNKAQIRRVVAPKATLTTTTAETATTETSTSVSTVATTTTPSATSP
jgi:hypothetical protein